jgi:hypothetical protein
MQGPTHLLAGVLIQKALRGVKPLLPQYFITAFLALISHGILDKLTRFTYHPPNALAGDWFWVAYHLLIALLFVFILVKYWRKYKLALIFSILPDFDWVVLHSSNFFSFQVPFWKDPVLHKSLFSILDFLPPFSSFNYLPDWSLEREAAMFEFTLLAILVTFIYMVKDSKVVTTDSAVSSETLVSTNWIDKLLIYQTCMDHEQSIRTSYQSLLTTLQVALFGLFFTLYQLNLTKLLWLLFVLGMFLCFPFGIACEFRARNVDVCRVRIVELIKGTDVESFFAEIKYRWIPFTQYGRLRKAGFWGEYLIGHWFERILISGMLIIWLILLWLFPSPLIIRACGILAVHSWIVYAFNIIELKGEIIPYITGRPRKHR